ncbi:MAG: hypothetical protein LRS46_00125 [Desulfurococcales archaeon]|nr:hypothetical protein [Desulfurococcales archaeon]
MEVVPSRSYKLDVRPYSIELDIVKKTIDYLREHHPLYYVVYRVMLESGARFEHVLLMLEKWSSTETIEIHGTSIVTRRLACVDSSFCRYYM